MLKLEPELAQGKDRKADRDAVWKRVHQLVQELSERTPPAVRAKARETLWRADELLCSADGLNNPDLGAPVILQAR